MDCRTVLERTKGNIITKYSTPTYFSLRFARPLECRHAQAVQSVHDALSQIRVGVLGWSVDGRGVRDSQAARAALAPLAVAVVRGPCLMVPHARPLLGIRSWVAIVPLHSPRVVEDGLGLRLRLGGRLCSLPRRLRQVSCNTSFIIFFISAFTSGEVMSLASEENSSRRLRLRRSSWIGGCGQEIKFSSRKTQAPRHCCILLRVHRYCKVVMNPNVLNMRPIGAIKKKEYRRPPQSGWFTTESVLRWSRVLMTLIAGAAAACDLVAGGIQLLRSFCDG